MRSNHVLKEPWTNMTLPAGQVRGIVWSLVGLRPDSQLWLPGTTTVAPFASVKSSKAERGSMTSTSSLLVDRRTNYNRRAHWRSRSRYLDEAVICGRSPLSIR